MFKLSLVSSPLTILTLTEPTWKCQTLRCNFDPKFQPYHPGISCERGFSLLARIKTKLRNRLNILTVDSLMMITSNGPEMSDADAMMTLLDESCVVLL